MEPRREMDDPGEKFVHLYDDEMPLKAEVDPYRKMIGGIPDDNMVAVEGSEA